MGGERCGHGRFCLELSYPRPSGTHPDDPNLKRTGRNQLLRVVETLDRGPGFR
jgi:hypothetical protein